MKSQYQLRSHIGSKTSIDRMKEFKEFKEECGKLFRRICKTVVEHERRSTIINHLKSNKYLMQSEKQTRQANLASITSKPPAKKLQQATIVCTTVMTETAKRSRDFVVTDFLKAATSIYCSRRLS